MTTINRLVLDLSHWNDAHDFAAIRGAGVRGIIHKATEGDYNTDPTYTARKAAALDAGLLWGAYHFGTNDDVHAQVDRFLAVADPDEATLLALDFEDYGDKSMTLDQAVDFISEVEARTGRASGVVLYSGNRIKDQLGDAVDPWFNARRLWLAQYASAPVVPPSWSEAWLWQYTDGEHGPEPHTCPGVNGPVDGDHYEGTPDDLARQWSGIEAAPVPPVPDEGQTVTITISIDVPPGVALKVNVE